MLTRLLLLAIFTLPSLVAFGADSRVLYPQANRPIFTQFQPPSSPDKPSFLLLPGVNRGWLSTDRLPSALRAKGYGFVTMNFSPQAFSVAQLPEGQKGLFESNTFYLADLAHEVAFVQNFYSKIIPGGQLTPVTLSYSGLISLLVDSPIVISTAPLTSNAVAYPDFEKYRLWLKQNETFNPLFGPLWTRGLLDQSYRDFWGKRIDAFIQDFGLPKQKRDQMVEGHVTLSRAAEDQAWQIAPQNKNTHWMVLGGKEKPSLLVHQLQTLREGIALGANFKGAFVPTAGHVIPSEATLVYLSFLKWVTQPSEVKTNLCLIIIDSEYPDQWTRVPCDHTLKWIDRKLDEIKGNNS